MRNSCWIVSLLMALFLPACGGSGPTMVTPTPTPTPCTQTTLATGAGPIAAKHVGQQSITTSTTGRVDLTVDWTFPASLIGVYLVPQGNCTTIDQFNARTCNFLIRSEPPGVKPRIVSAPNVAPGTYLVLAANFSAQDESVSLLAVLSSSGCPGVASVSLPHNESHERIRWEPMGIAYP
jgi:hypothetical protein